MTVGFQIFNQNNESVIDGETPTYVLTYQATIAGTAGTGGYSYDFSAFGYQTIKFLQLEINDWVVTNSFNYLSNRSTLQVKVPAPANTLPDPTGYGIVIRNSSGQKVWFANAPVAIIEDYAVLPPASSTFTTNADWAAITCSIPAVYPGPQGFNRYVISGIRRFSGYYQYYQFNAGVIPVDPILPSPISVLFARS